MATQYSKIQAVAANNGAVAATTVAATIAATQQGSTLIAIVMAAVAGETITISANWTPFANGIPTFPAGGTLQAFYRENVPAGSTSVTATLSAASLASIIVYEIGGQAILTHAQLYDIVASKQVSNPNAAAWSAGAESFQSSNELVIVAIGYINAAAITATYPTGITEDAATIGTAAGGNGGLRAASNMSIGVGSIVNFAGTLSGIPTDGPSVLVIAYMFSPLGPNNGYVGPAQLEPSIYH